MELDQIGNHTDMNLMKVNAALCFVMFFYEWQPIQRQQSHLNVHLVIFMCHNQKVLSIWNVRNMAKIYEDSWTLENEWFVIIIKVSCTNAINFNQITLGWLHHRSPAILGTDEAVSERIDFKRVTDTKLAQFVKTS